jgi:thiol:disulfide interchange protein DsbA
MRRFVQLLIYFIITMSCSSVFAMDSFEQGRDYLVLKSNASTPSLYEAEKNQIKVVEFFSYGCPACFKLEPHLEKWLAHKPHHVYFERIPVMFQSDWIIYAKYYFAFESLNLHQSALHQATFNAIQVQNLDLTQLNVMESFLSGQGINQKSFLGALQSPQIDLDLANAKKIATDSMIFQVPAIIIDGKYKVDPSLSGANYPKLFQTVNYLIHLSHHEKNKT